MVATQWLIAGWLGTHSATRLPGSWTAFDLELLLLALIRRKHFGRFCSAMPGIRKVMPSAPEMLRRIGREPFRYRRSARMLPKW